MAILSVGAGETYATLSAAVAQAADGDTIEVAAGTYLNDFPENINTDITIEGVGGLASFVATEQPPNGKAILDTDANVTIENIALSGCTVADGNGAAIRYEGGNLTLVDDDIYDNQNGILGGPIGTPYTGTVDIESSEFALNGAGDGYTHNIYIGDVANLTVEDSYIHDADLGHEIKSRAATTDIIDNRILDNDSTASYDIDLPNAGNAVIAGNTIQKGPNAQNSFMIAYGEEGNVQPGSLVVSGNTLVNDLGNEFADVVWNATSTDTADILGNGLYAIGSDQVAMGPAVVSGNTVLASAPSLDTSGAIATLVQQTDMPAVSVPAGATLTIGQPGAIANLAVGDGDAPFSEIYTVRLGDTDGLLSVAGGSGAGVAGQGSTAVTLTGSLGQVDAALSGLIDTDDVGGADTITLGLSDALGDGAAPASFAVEATTAPTSPAISAIGFAPATGATAPFAGIGFSGDTNEAEEFVVSVSAGTLTPATLSNGDGGLVTAQFGGADGSGIVFDGTAAQLQTYLGSGFALTGFGNYTATITTQQVGTYAGDTETNSMDPIATFVDPTDNGVEGSGTGTLSQAVVACYLRGTRIATPSGEVAVEAFGVGDRVCLAGGGELPIRWIGMRRYARPAAETWPVCLRAGALADGVPSRDLFVSPLHAMLIDGVLVPARSLVNGVSVVVCAGLDAVEYFHVELDRHAAVIAEGAASESYADCDNRWMFDNADTFASRNGNVAWSFCAPRAEDGPAVDAIRQRLAARAATLGDVRTAHARPFVLADGHAAWPQQAAGGRHTFHLPATPSDLRIVSRNAVRAVELRSHGSTIRSGGCRVPSALLASLTGPVRVDVIAATTP